MKRRPGPEELHLWSKVAATVHPLPGRVVPEIPAPKAEAALSPRAAASTAKTPAPKRSPAPPTNIEPGRKRLIVREREPLEARIDLHGLNHDQARAALQGFLLRAWSEGYRAALVITGKGTRGDGVLRRFTPEWLAAPPLREIVAGVSEAHRRHGGEGALYVALKRRPRD